jgi:hypothetical protein
MKPSDFMKEDADIVANAHEMHKDHEVQMAREEVYHCASNAIQLHKLLKSVSEESGLDGWASEKISIANDYLRTVREWLEYELMTNADNGQLHVQEDASAGATSSAAIASAPPMNLLGRKKVIKRKMK